MTAPFLSMDVVYVLGGGSKVDDLELRYSLRSVEKHLTNVDQVVIVGKRPEWIKDIFYIEAADEHACKETNIYSKILKASLCPSVSDDFLFFNDDHFLLKDYKAEEFPFFYKGGLLQIMGKLPPYNKYSTCVHRTALVLKERGFAEKNFDTHTPIIYNKTKFAQIMPTYDWSQRFSYVVKSLYANSVGIEGIKEPDCKINDAPDLEELKRRIQDRSVFSIGNGAIAQGMHDLWRELYPNPSKWESVI